MNKTHKNYPSREEIISCHFIKVIFFVNRKKRFSFIPKRLVKLEMIICLLFSKYMKHNLDGVATIHQCLLAISFVYWFFFDRHNKFNFPKE